MRRQSDILNFSFFILNCLNFQRQGMSTVCSGKDPNGDTGLEGRAGGLVRACAAQGFGNPVWRQLRARNESLPLHCRASHDWRVEKRHDTTHFEARYGRAVAGRSWPIVTARGRVGRRAAVIRMAPPKTLRDRLPSTISPFRRFCGLRQSFDKSMKGFFPGLQALIQRLAAAAALAAIAASWGSKGQASPAVRGVVGSASRAAVADFSELARREEGRPLPSRKEQPTRPKLRSLAGSPPVDPSLVIPGRATRAVFGSSETVSTSEPVADGGA